MRNLEINFDRYFFVFFDVMRVALKKVLTALHLRNQQSCKKCGRDQHIVWSVDDEVWDSLPRKWHNHCLCLECFAEEYGKDISKVVHIK